MAWLAVVDVQLNARREHRDFDRTEQLAHIQGLHQLRLCRRQLLTERAHRLGAVRGLLARPRGLRAPLRQFSGRGGGSGLGGVDALAQLVLCALLVTLRLLRARHRRRQLARLQPVPLVLCLRRRGSRSCFLAARCERRVLVNERGVGSGGGGELSLQVSAHARGLLLRRLTTPPLLLQASLRRLAGVAALRRQLHRIAQLLRGRLARSSGGVFGAGSKPRPPLVLARRLRPRLLGRRGEPIGLRARPRGLRLHLRQPGAHRRLRLARTLRLCSEGGLVLGGCAFGMRARRTLRCFSLERRPRCRLCRARGLGNAHALCELLSRTAQGFVEIERPLRRAIGVSRVLFNLQP